MSYIKKLYRTLFVPNINSVFLCRLAIKLHEKNRKIISRHIRYHILYKYGIHLGVGSKLGNNIAFPHPQGIIIGEGVIIGDGCTIYHQVTLGKKMGSLNNNIDYPCVGNNVTIFPGAKIIGSVRIGENSVIAPNSVVINDVEANSIYAGIPAKKIGINYSGN